MDFSKAFQYIPDTIVVLSPEYKVLAATDEYLRVTLRTREELIGKDFLEAFPDNPGSADSKNGRLLRESLDRALTTKKIDFFEPRRYDIPKPEGGFDIRYWEATHTPVLDETGEVQFIIQRTSDVTDREITKRALSESENKFQFMAESMPQLIITTNEKGEYTYFNQRWTDYTGVPVKELLETREKVIHPDDYPPYMEKWLHALDTGEPFQIEFRILSKEGQYRWFLHRRLPMRNNKGKVVMWVGSMTDVHDTRTLVQELEQTNEQMVHLSEQVQQAYQKAEKERKTYERLFQQAPAFFCILKGPEHVFELVNPGYQQLFPKRELVNRTVAEALPEVIEQGFIDILDKVYSTGETYKAKEIRVLLDRFETGQLEELFLNFIYQAHYEDDQITGILVFGYEVTEQVRLRQKLQESGHA